MTPMRAGLRSLPQALLVLAMTVMLAACGSSSPAADGPAGVVRTALDRVAAKDVDGLRALACAGQEDVIRQQLGVPSALGSDLLPGVDTQKLMDAVRLDTTKVKIGDAVITGDTASVPVSGDLGITFDAVAMRPILRQVLASSGRTMTDAQIDALVGGLQAYGQDVPITEAVRLVRESGSWKLCQQDLGLPSASP